MRDGCCENQRTNKRGGDEMVCASDCHDDFSSLTVWLVALNHSGASQEGTARNGFVLQTVSAGGVMMDSLRRLCGLVSRTRQCGACGPVC